MKRYKLGNVRLRRIDIASSLQDAEGLKQVAAALRSCPLLVVDEQNRTFSMPPLLQTAVGIVLGWQQQCARMKALLHMRFGQFGDDVCLDVRLHSMIREVFPVAAHAIRRMRHFVVGHEASWCTGMLLRLYEVAHQTNVIEIDFLPLLSNAHSCLVTDLLYVHLIRSGDRGMTLKAVVDTAPFIRDVIVMNPDFQSDEEALVAVEMETSRGMSEQAAKDLYVYRKFDLSNCLCWSPEVHASLVAYLVHAHVIQVGFASPEGKFLSMQAISEVPIIKDLMELPNVTDRDLGRLVKGRFGLKIVDDVGGSSNVLLQQGAADASEYDMGVVKMGHQVRAIRWRLQTLGMGNAEWCKRVIDEISGVYDQDSEDRWEVGVALGTAFHSAGLIYDGWAKDKARIAFERALRLRVDVLGEQHPYTATTLTSTGAAYRDDSDFGDLNTAIVLHERALRICKDTLGLHPTTANTMVSMGAAYCKKRQYKEAIELYKQALHIHERVVGWMHRDTARVILNISTAYYDLGDFEKAEELGLEAMDICTKTLGKDHDRTKEARSNLAKIQKANGALQNPWRYCMLYNVSANY